MDLTLIEWLCQSPSAVLSFIDERLGAFFFLFQSLPDWTWDEGNLVRAELCEDTKRDHWKAITEGRIRLVGELYAVYLVAQESGQRRIAKQTREILGMIVDRNVADRELRKLLNARLLLFRKASE